MGLILPPCRTRPCNSSQLCFALLRAVCWSGREQKESSREEFSILARPAGVGCTPRDQDWNGKKKKSTVEPPKKKKVCQTLTCGDPSSTLNGGNETFLLYVPFFYCHTYLLYIKVLLYSSPLFKKSHPNDFFHLSLSLSLPLFHATIEKEGLGFHPCSCSVQLQ